MHFTHELKKFVCIGHITDDTKPISRLGGSVSYSAIAAKRLGCDTFIITKCPKNHKYIDQLTKLGITVHVLPSNLSTITTFKNVYSEQGKRTQECPQQQEEINICDFEKFPKDILQDATILAAPVIGEIDTRLFPLLSRYGRVVVTPQGYFRNITATSEVKQKRWNCNPKDISTTHTIILSDEDITRNGKLDKDFLNELRKNSNILILTIGAKGSIVYTKKNTIRTTAFPLEKNEIKDFTGAGDTYAVAFVTQFALTHNTQEASVNANFYAALKIIGFGGIGINSIPTKKQIQKFLSNHPSRISNYLKSNSSAAIRFFESN